MSEEEATDISCLGADDLMPISIYIITKAGKPELLSELEFLNDVTNMEYVNLELRVFSLCLLTFCTV